MLYIATTLQAYTGLKSHFAEFSLVLGHHHISDEQKWEEEVQKETWMEEMGSSSSVLFMDS